MKGKILLFLFALPFFGVGVWMGYSIGSDLLDAHAMRSWVPTDATLTAAGYDTRSGDGSDTYEAYAQYTYAFDGRHYSADRVSIAGGGDNIGDYQQDLGRRLSAAMGRGESVIVYVNPERPAEAVIDRSVRWGLLGFKSVFLFVFGGVGLGMLIAVFRSPAEKDVSGPEFDDQPWLANDAWQSSTIRSGSRTSMWAAWGFAAIWNLISAPLPFIIYEEVLEKENLLALVGLLFPVVGLGLLSWAVSRTLEWRRFGPAPVMLDPFPGSIGGHVGGTIDVNLPHDPGTRFSVTLTHLHSYMSGSGDDRSRRESAKWQDNQVAHAAAGPKGTRLSFRFEVPDDLTASDADQSNDAYYLWRLNLKAELAGTDFDRDYEIPVYATGARSSRLSNLSIDAARSEQRHIDLEAIRKLVRIEHGMHGKSVFFPMGRFLNGGIVGGLFGGIFAAIGWFLMTQEDHVLMGSAFGLAGWLILVSSFYFVCNSLEVIQNGNSLRTIRRVLGIPVRTREMLKSDFVGFRKKSSMSTQSGTKHVMHYKLCAVSEAGEALVIGEGFKGSNQANAAADFFASEFGLAVKRDMQDAGDRFDRYNVLTAD